MKTPNKIKKGLGWCSCDTTLCTETCPYYGPLSNGVDCASELQADALAYIQQLERERDALAALYKPHGTCGSCKHNGSKLCDNCTNKDNRWEWAGIKEDNP